MPNNERRVSETSPTDQLAKGQAPEDGSTALRKALGLAERQPRIAITDASLVVDDELNAAAERLETPIPRGARPTPEGAWRRLRYWGTSMRIGSPCSDVSTIYSARRS